MEGRAQSPLQDSFRMTFFYESGMSPNCPVHPTLYWHRALAGSFGVGLVLVTGLPLLLSSPSLGLLVGSS